MTPNEFGDKFSKAMRPPGGDGASTPAKKLPPPPAKVFEQKWPEAKWYEMDMSTHHGADWTKVKDRMGNTHRSQFPNKGPNRGKEIPYKPHETN